MEFRITPYSAPALSFNFEEIKAELAQRLESYHGVAYTESQMAEAKADRASLNKLKKALEDARIAQKKQYMEPYSVFEKQIKELVGMIEAATGGIDKQIKAKEESDKQEKRTAIEAIYAEIGFPAWVTLPRIADPRWLNKSVSLESVRDQLTGKAEEIKANMEALEASDGAAAGIECYQRSLDFSMAVQAARRAAEIERQRKARETAKPAEMPHPEPQPQPVHEPRPAPVYDEPAPKPVKKYAVAFRCLLTAADAEALKAFFRSRGIYFEAIKED